MNSGEADGLTAPVAFSTILTLMNFVSIRGSKREQELDQVRLFLFRELFEIPVGFAVAADPEEFLERRVTAVMQVRGRAVHLDERRRIEHPVEIHVILSPHVVHFHVGEILAVMARGATGFRAEKEPLAPFGRVGQSSVGVQRDAGDRAQGFQIFVHVAIFRLGHPFEMNVDETRPGRRFAGRTDARDHVRRGHMRVQHALRVLWVFHAVVQQIPVEPIDAGIRVARHARVPVVQSAFAVEKVLHPAAFCVQHGRFFAKGKDFRLRFREAPRHLPADPGLGDLNSARVVDTWENGQIFGEVTGRDGHFFVHRQRMDSRKFRHFDPCDGRREGADSKKEDVLRINVVHVAVHPFDEFLRTNEADFTIPTDGNREEFSVGGDANTPRVCEALLVSVDQVGARPVPLAVVNREPVAVGPAAEQLGRDRAVVPVRMHHEDVLPIGRDRNVAQVDAAVGKLVIPDGFRLQVQNAKGTRNGRAVGRNEREVVCDVDLIFVRRNAH